MFDAVTGITLAPAGAVRWFGQDLSALPHDRVLAVLHRLAPIAPGGGLIGNISMAENILLPREARRLPGEGMALLHEVAGRRPWSEWFSWNHLWSLPYEEGMLGRTLAAVLRAWLVRPEAIVACDPERTLEGAEREILHAALSWLRRELPGCAWLFIRTESALPAGFARSNLDSELP